ncbi:MAG: hypothetical protein ACPGO5_02550 [Patescibacteria group bacterium]
MTSVFLHTLKLLTWDLLRDILYFPVWWYTEGLLLMWQRFFTAIMSWQHRLGLGIWVKNWFKPMYAQFDWQGRLISFFFRTLTILWKTIEFFLGFVLIILGFFLYLVLPFVAIVLLVYSFLV